jgi:hypothetical protein
VKDKGKSEEKGLVMQTAAKEERVGAGEKRKRNVDDDDDVRADKTLQDGPTQKNPAKKRRRTKKAFNIDS